MIWPFKAKTAPDETEATVESERATVKQAAKTNKEAVADLVKATLDYLAAEKADDSKAQ